MADPKVVLNPLYEKLRVEDKEGNELGTFIVPKASIPYILDEEVVQKVASRWIGRRAGKQAGAMSLYHSTKGRFTGLPDPDRSGLGTHFGTPFAALDRARQYQRVHGGDFATYAFRVTVQNPLRMPDVGGWDDEPQVEAGLIQVGVMTPQDLLESRGLSGKAFFDWARGKIEKAGYDSVVYRNRMEHKGSDTYIIWDNSMLRRLRGASYKDKVPGGLADKKKPSDFDQKQLEKGADVEKEHTKDRGLAREIAMDHLTEDPSYYIKLEKMEKEAFYDPQSWYYNAEPGLNLDTVIQRWQDQRGNVPVEFHFQTGRVQKNARVALPPGKWVEGFPKDLDLEQRKEVWSLYHASYGSIGEHIASLSDMLSKYKIFWLQDVGGDSQIEAFIGYKKTKFGNKIGVMGTDGSPAAKHALVHHAMSLLKRAGWYAEASGRPAQLMDQMGVPRVTNRAMVEMVRPDGEWVGDGWYTRDIGGLGQKKKALYGNPRVSSMAMHVAARYQEKKKIKTQKGEDAIVYVYSERQVQKRNKDKAERIEKLRGRLDELRAKVKKDLKSEDIKTRMTALVVGLINDTYERVGNDTSASEGHVGVTGWTVGHVKVGDGKATITYVGKSGVKQEKVTTDAGLIKGLREAVKGKKKGDPIFEYEDGKVDATKVNEYLKPLGITAKDIRGLHANREMQERLTAVRSKGGKLPTDAKEREKKLKEEFKEALEGTAEAVGHETATLKSQYLVPGLEESFLKDGTVVKKLDKKGVRHDHGNCFDAAGKYFMDLAGEGNARLVHGEVMGQGPLEGVRFANAWVEQGNTVIDKSNGRDAHLPKVIYYALGHIDEIGNIYRYTFEQFRKKVLQFKHWGPWGLKTSTGL